MLRDLFRRNQVPENLRPKHYDVLVVLGGNIRYENGHYHSTTWEDGPEKSIGSFWRPRAAAELVMQGRTHRLIFSTGTTHPNSNSPSEAQVLLEEFHRTLVDLDDLDNIHYSVEQDRDSLTTIQNARNVTRMLKDKKYKNARTVGILTSSYQLARAYEMFQAEFKRQGLNKQILLISAERVLIDSERSKSGTFSSLDTSRRAYRTPRLQEQMANEKRGILDFRSGKYNSYPPGDKTY